MIRTLRKVLPNDYSQIHSYFLSSYLSFDVDFRRSGLIQFVYLFLIIIPAFGILWAHFALISSKIGGQLWVSSI